MRKFLERFGWIKLGKHDSAIVVRQGDSRVWFDGHLPCGDPNALADASAIVATLLLVRAVEIDRMSPEEIEEAVQQSMGRAA